MIRKVLIIEDDKLMSQTLKEALEEKSFEVFQAYDGEEGIEKIKKEKPDLVLLDIVMPKKDGLEVLTEIRNSSDNFLKNLPIIVITASVNQSQLEKTFEFDVKDALIKSQHTVSSIVDKVKLYSFN